MQVTNLAQLREAVTDAEQRDKVNAGILRDVARTERTLFTAGVERLLSIPDAQWDAAQAADDAQQAQQDAGFVTETQLTTAEFNTQLQTAMSNAFEAAYQEKAHALSEAMPWQTLVEQLSPVGKLVHGQMMQDDIAEQERRGMLTAQRAKAYEQELKIQASRVGCDQYSGSLRIGPEWVALDEQSVNDARSITNTYNRDLARQVAKIRQDVPTANRHVYAKRLRDWNAGRSEWKNKDISQFTGNSARSKAQADFFRNNGIGEGYATLEPRTAVCPVCQGFLNRGEVPIPVAMSNPGPFHVKCIVPGQRVLMADGTTKLIEGVVVGDMVATTGQTGQCRVVQTFRRQTQEQVYRVFVAGQELLVTGEHPLKTMRGWIAARSLRIGDLVLCERVERPIHAEYKPITEIRIEDYDGDVLNLETEHEEYIVEGICVHNCPHLWETHVPKLSPDDCANLWRPGGPSGGGVPSVPIEPVVEEPEYNFTTVDDPEDWAQEHYEGWEDDLERHERYAISDYTNSKYADINRALRYDDAELLDIWRGHIDSIESALSKANTPEDIVTYRASRAMKTATGQRMGLEDTKKLVGSIINDKGFMSTSLDMDEALAGFAGKVKTGQPPVLYKISVPAGTPGAAVRNLSAMEFEEEFLLQRGMKMLVTDVAEKGYGEIVTEVSVRIIL